MTDLIPLAGASLRLIKGRGSSLEVIPTRNRSSSLFVRLHSVEQQEQKKMQISRK